MENIELERNLSEIQKDLNHVMEIKSSNFKSETFFKNSNESLILQGETKNDLFSKLKKSWSRSHSRIKDLRQNSLQKFPQIYQLKYKIFLKKNSDFIKNKRIMALSKYTFNFDSVEVDIGGVSFLRDKIGKANFFFNIRNYSFNNSFFNQIGYSNGERFLYETNYLIDKKYLLDYCFNQNLLINENLHKISVFFLEKQYNDLVLSLGYNQSTKELFVESGLKKRIDNNFSLNLHGKIGKNSMCIKSELKQRLNDSISVINKSKINLNRIFPDFSFKNYVNYSKFNRCFTIGYSYSLDGYAIEIGYKYSGINLRLPIILKLNDSIINKPYYDAIFHYLKRIIVFSIINIGFNIALNAYKYLFDSKMTNDEIIKKKEEVETLRIYSKKIILNLEQQAEINSKIENQKFEKGLIIEFAFYGSKSSLKNIINQSLIMNIQELEKYVEDISNEVINVTIPCRYLIKNDNENSYSSIFFCQKPKTTILGFINPIYKSYKSPYLLICYKINNVQNFALKKDSEIFQIPEFFN